MRKNHAAERPLRLYSGAKRRGGYCQPNDHSSCAGAAQYHHGISKLRPVAAPDGSAQYRLWPEAAQMARGGYRAAGGGAAANSQSRRAWRGESDRTVGRPAAAGGAGESPGHRAPGAGVG